MPTEPLRPRAQEIVAAARELLEEAGPSALSMRALAQRLGIRAPSIYKHLPDKRAVENALISIGFEEVAVVLEEAERSDDPLGALAAAYRRYAKEHPHLYRLMTEHPLQREQLEPGVEDRARQPAVQAVGDDPDLARAVWGFMHGLTILELDDRFPPDAELDRAWERGLDAFRALRA
ncbi:MAG TPA: TetR/AcrR family transcriptional regulator [Solirubrobacteraceae bacterium]|jgi:AcrR family transcriptional regulator